MHRCRRWGFQTCRPRACRPGTRQFRRRSRVLRCSPIRRSLWESGRPEASMQHRCLRHPPGISQSSTVRCHLLQTALSRPDLFPTVPLQTVPLQTHHLASRRSSRPPPPRLRPLWSASSPPIARRRHRAARRPPSRADPPQGPAAARVAVGSPRTHQGRRAQARRPQGRIGREIDHQPALFEARPFGAAPLQDRWQRNAAADVAHGDHQIGAGP